MARRLPALRSVAGPLQRFLGPDTGPDGLVADARRAGLVPLAVLEGPADLPGVPADAPRSVVVHEPAAPDVRAAFLGAMAGRRVLALSTREWEIWSEGCTGRLVGPTTWGAPLSADTEDDDEARRRRLRQAADLLWTALPPTLDRGAAPEDLRAVSRAFRSLCARETLPSRFPAIAPADAPSDAVYAALLGVAHATFSGEVAAEPGTPLPPEARLPRSPAVERFATALGADLPAHLRADLLGLYLLPGPLGTAHHHRLVAVVPDDEPLHRAASLRRRLHAHLGMLPRDLVAGLFQGGAAPLVLTRAALWGQLRRRLWRRPLRRLAIRLDGHLLLGDDVLLEGCDGVDFTRADLRVEVAAAIAATSAVFDGGTAAEARELLFGCWPRIIALLGGTDPATPLADIHADLAGRTDPAVSRVGSGAQSQPWGDPVALDRGRAAPVLRDWGPALIRMQEVALEVLG